MQIADSALSHTISFIAEQSAPITMDCESDSGVVTQTDDILTVTTTDSLQSPGPEHTETFGVRDTNLNQTATGKTLDFSPDPLAQDDRNESAASLNESSTSQRFPSETSSSFSRSLPASRALPIQEPRTSVTLDSEVRSSSQSIPTNLGAPVLDRAVATPRREKQNLSNLLSFVAHTEKARITKKDNFAKDHVMKVNCPFFSLPFM